MNRRNLILSGVAGAVALEVGHQWWKNPMGKPEGFELASAYGNWVDTFIEKLDPPLKSDIVFFDPGTMKMTNYEVPFRVHMLVQNPHDPDQLVMVSKWGKDLCSFSRGEGRVTKYKLAGDNRRYFGHAAWDARAGGFWVVEQDDRDFNGYLTLRGPDLEIITQVPTHGLFPHDLQMAGDSTILVANSGDFFSRYDGKLPFKHRISNMSWIDTRSGDIKRRVEFPHIMNLAGATHFQQIPGGGDLVVGTLCEDEDQPTTVLRVRGEMVEQLLPEKRKDLFTGEVLSFAFLEKEQKVIWTHSKAHGLFSCALAPQSPVELIIPARTKGLANVNGDLIVAHANSQQMLRLRDGEIIQRSRAPVRLRYRWGSHLSRLNLA